ncbi:MAG: carboxypeptidase regulatory-like domain-containing protein [Bryobacteraceae bacterium]
MKSIRVLAATLGLLLAAMPAAYSQMMSGQVTGRLVDAAGGVIAGAEVRLTNDLSKQAREFRTDSNGNFTFTNVPPGNYNLTIAHPGFKKYEQKAINVGAVERVALPEISLQLGDVSTSVEVQSSAVRVATDSSDRGVGINTTQIQDTVTKGRNFMMLLSTLPGVQDLNQNDSRGWGTGSPTLMGGQSGQKLLVLDGAASQDSGNRDFGYIAPSVDAIAEVRVLMANYNAEYGARSGGQMNVMVKSGTNQFHGSAYYFIRNEALNANEFFNNKTNVARPRYKYHNVGGTFGGPFIIPGTNFNKSHNKLFWFFSYDYLYTKNVTAPNRYTMPTALERAGDFSATTTTTGAVIPIRDPLAGAPFAGNRVPASRIDRTGLAMMNLFPLPNTTDPTGQRQYNAEFVNPFQQPRHDRILRVDYPMSSKANMYVRLLQDYTGNDGYGQILGALGDGWRQFPHGYDIPSAGAVASLIYTFKPNLISETMWGITRGHQINTPTDQNLYNNSLLPFKDAQGNTINLPRLFPGSNTLNLRPQINFGFPSGFTAQSQGLGVPNAPSYGFDSRWPFDGTDQVQTVSSNLTWIHGAHNVKGGVYLEKMARNVSVYSTYNTAGSYYFGSDTSSPVDTGYPYSNLLTGGFFSYGEDSLKQINHARYTQFDWFLQDTWKVSRRLTLDLGMRFQWMGSLHTAGQRLGLFNESLFSASKAGQPLFPALQNGQKVAVNPVTGTVYPYVRQGTFDPASYSGNPFSGVKDYTGNFWKAPPITLGPRIGFAFDPFANGKTAIRGGFGIFYDRAATVDYIGALGVGRGPLAAPPNFLAPTILNSSFSALAGSTALLTPQDIQGGAETHLAPTTYNWSFGIQREIPWGMVFDIAYVANTYKHGFNSAPNGLELNAVPPFTTWTPQGGTTQRFIDPTSSSGALYSTNLIRSQIGFKGIGQIPLFVNNGTSSYNSLQVQLNRRIMRKVTWSANYTWSKTLLYNRQQFTDDYLTRAETGNRPHAFNANFGYEIPSPTTSSKFLKQATDGWRIMGTAQIFSGAAMAPGCGFTANPVGYPNGTPTGGVLFRCQMGTVTKDAVWLNSGAKPSDVGSTADPRLWYPVDPNNFQLPKGYAPFTRGIIGNMPPVVAYGPGAQIFNLALQKEFRVREGHALQFKVEATNAFNHFNPSNPNMTLTRNYNTGANTNSAFGTIQGAQYQSRRAILSLRYAF